MPPKKHSSVQKGKVERESDRKNAAAIQKAVASQAADWALDPDVLNALPASNKAQLIMQFLPKAQPVDQDLEKNLLSLSVLLKDLPDASELTRQLAVAKSELIKQKAYRKTEADMFSQWRGTVPSEDADKFERWFNDIRENFIAVGQQMASREVLEITEKEAKRCLRDLLKKST